MYPDKKTALCQYFNDLGLDLGKVETKKAELRRALKKQALKKHPLRSLLSMICRRFDGEIYTKTDNLVRAAAMQNFENKLNTAWNHSATVSQWESDGKQGEKPPLPKHKTPAFPHIKGKKL